MTQSRRRRAMLAVLAIVVAVAVLGVAVWAILRGTEPDATPEPPAPPSLTADAEPESAPEPEPEPIRIGAMGDMLPHDTVNLSAEVEGGGWDYGPFFAGITGELDAFDAIFCNQEVPSAGVEHGISGYPVFNAPREFAVSLREDAGCDLVNLANNHAADLGVTGIAETRAVWDDLDPVSISGANRSTDEQNTIVYGDVSGIRTALVSFAEASNAPIDGVSLNFMADTELVSALITEARAHADLVVVSAHWGTEDTHQVNDQQRAHARQFADLGADVVVGTGPHVLQPVEWLDRPDGKRTLVWYSLGNMLSSQLTLAQRTGVIASFEAVPEDGGITIANPEAVITYMHYGWSPEQEAAGDLLSRDNLSISPMASANELLASTRFGVDAGGQVAASAEILGPEVSVR